MKKRSRLLIILCVIISILTTPIAFAAQDAEKVTKPSVANIIPGNIYIPKGTMIQAELIQGVNSGKNNVGDRTTFKLTESLVINGVIVVSKGTVGEAVVKNVKRAGAWGKGGGIELEARSTKTINNIDVPLSLDTKKYGGGQGMVVPWLLVGVFSGFVRGKNQDIPTGTRFTVAVDSDVDLGVVPERLASTMTNNIVITTQ